MIWYAGGPGAWPEGVLGWKEETEETAAEVMITGLSSPGLDHLRGRQPHPLPPGPLRRIQAAAIGVPHASGIAHQAPVG